MLSVKISNSLNNPLKLNYSVMENGLRKILTIELPSRALLHDCYFAKQEYYDAFVKQNECFIASEKIIIGNTKESKLENANVDNATKEKAMVRKKKNKQVETIENAVSTKNTKLKVSVSEE